MYDTWTIPMTHIESKGKFEMDGVPPTLVEKNVAFYVGWFEDTLPPFLREQCADGVPCSLIHIDCDIYESTKCVFDALEDRIVEGTDN